MRYQRVKYTRPQPSTVSSGGCTPAARSHFANDDPRPSASMVNAARRSPCEVVTPSTTGMSAERISRPVTLVWSRTRIVRSANTIGLSTSSTNERRTDNPNNSGSAQRGTAMAPCSCAPKGISMAPASINACHTSGARSRNVRRPSAASAWVCRACGAPFRHQYSTLSFPLAGSDRCAVNASRSTSSTCAPVRAIESAVIRPATLPPSTAMGSALMDTAPSARRVRQFVWHLAFSVWLSTFEDVAAKARKCCPPAL